MHFQFRRIAILVEFGKIKSHCKIGRVNELLKTSLYKAMSIA
jgi:hypothetical protein